MPGREDVSAGCGERRCWKGVLRCVYEVLMLERRGDSAAVVRLDAGHVS